MPSVINTAVNAGTGFNQMMHATRDVFSAEIWYAAQPITKFDQFTTKRSELGGQPGRRIQIPKMGNLKRGGPLREGVDMTTQSMSQSQQSIEVGEWGNAIGFSEYLLQVAYYDQLSAASILLGRDMALVLDLALRDVARGGVNVIYAGGVNSRGALTSTMVFDTVVVKDGVEALETANAPKWAGDHWICFAHPHQMRGFRDDPDWINASLYSGVNQIYTGEVGRYEDTRFVSTTVMPNGANNARDPVTNAYVDPGYAPELRGAGSGGINVYQAVMFGENSIGHATGLPVELRDNDRDFGRQHGLAWYSIFGQDILEAANLVVIESA